MPAEDSGLERHRRDGVSAAACRVITVSDTRRAETDASGALAAALIEAAGHRVTGREIVPDDPARLRAAILAALDDGDCEALVLTGGTGVSPRDGTAEVVATICERVIPGFGELFRMLSHAEIGAAAMLSRALAGIRGGKPVFALPGSPAAVRLGLERLVLPELGHLLGELRKGRDD